MHRDANELRNLQRRRTPAPPAPPRWIETGGAGNSGTPKGNYAKITGAIGTEPPWIYTGVQVAHDGSDDFDPENFTEVSGGADISGKLINLNEIGNGGVGVNKLEEGAIVQYFQMGSRFACVGLNYKGTW